MLKKTFRLLNILVTFMVLLMVVSPIMADSDPVTTPTVWTDKSDYAPEETVIIYGSGFEPGLEVLVKVTRPDGSVVTGDGSFTEGSDTVTTDAEGKFTYYYLLDGIEGTYTVEVFNGDNLLASTTFQDTPPAVPNLISPANGSTTSDNTVSLNFSSPSGTVLYYHVRVGTSYSNPTTVTGIIYEANPSTSNPTTSALANGTYYWQARAYGFTGLTLPGWSNWSAWWSFTVDADVTPPPVPVLVSPANNSTIIYNTVTLIWNPVTDPSTPVSYEAEVYNSSNTRIFTTTNLLGQWITNTQAEVAILGIPILTDGAYHWKVRAKDAQSNISDWSEFWYFTVDIDKTIPPPPLLVSPANNSTVNDNTPTLVWDPVIDPAIPVQYQVQVYNRYEILIFDTPLWIPGTQATVEVDILGGLPYLTDATYHWRARARDAMGNTSEWSEFWYFEVETGARQFSATISPTTSNVGETQNYTVTFTNLSTEEYYWIGSAIFDIPAGWSASWAVISAVSPLRDWSVSIEDGPSGETRLVANPISLQDLTYNHLAPGEFISITFSATAPSPSPLPVYTWTASAFDERNYTEAYNLVGPQPQVTMIYPDIGCIKKVELEVDVNNDGIAGPGDTLKYSNEIKNNGDGIAYEVVFTDTPDIHTTLLPGSVTTTQGLITQGNTQGDFSVVIELGDMPAGGQALVTFKVKINNPVYVNKISNQAIIQGRNFANILSDADATPPVEPTVIKILASPVRSVGGEVAPVDKVKLFLPYIGLPLALVLACMMGLWAIRRYSVN